MMRPSKMNNSMETPPRMVSIERTDRPNELTFSVRVRLGESTDPTVVKYAAVFATEAEAEAVAILNPDQLPSIAVQVIARALEDALEQNRELASKANNHQATASAIEKLLDQNVNKTPSPRVGFHP
jgi:hypothetical protein